MQRRRRPRSQQKLVIAIAGGIIVLIIAINALLMGQTSVSDRYLMELQEISDQSRVITQYYEDSIGKWEKGIIDDVEMLQITDNNLEQLYSLLSRLKALEPSEKFKEGHEMSVLSLEYELQSNKHMRKYVETGDQMEYEKSSELLQLAFNYESRAFAAFARTDKDS